MRMLPPAPALFAASPFARILPSSCSVPALMRATPPPERHGVHVVPVENAPAPPGVFGSNGDPYAAGTFPPPLPPWPPWLPAEKLSAPPVSVGLSVARSYVSAVPFVDPVIP